MNEKTSDIIFDIMENGTMERLILYAEFIADKPRGIDILNPIAWIRYLKRKREGKGEVIATFDLSKEDWVKFSL